MKNHLVIGDFNIDILQINNLSSECLNNFLEKGYIPGFQGVTRPSINNSEESSIDNVYIKTKSLNTSSIKFTKLITDHFSLFVSINKIK